MTGEAAGWGWCCNIERLSIAHYERSVLHYHG